MHLCSRLPIGACRLTLAERLGLKGVPQAGSVSKTRAGHRLWIAHSGPDIGLLPIRVPRYRSRCMLSCRPLTPTGEELPFDVLHVAGSDFVGAAIVLGLILCNTITSSRDWHASRPARSLARSWQDSPSNSRTTVLATATDSLVVSCPRGCSAPPGYRPLAHPPTRTHTAVTG